MLGLLLSVVVALGVVFGEWICSKPQRFFLGGKLLFCLLLVSWESLLPMLLPPGVEAKRDRCGYCWILLNIDLMLGIHGRRTPHHDPRLLRSRTKDDSHRWWSPLASASASEPPLLNRAAPETRSTSCGGIPSVRGPPPCSPVSGAVSEASCVFWWWFVFGPRARAVEP